jgi:hypothetical protein
MQGVELGGNVVHLVNIEMNNLQIKRDLCVQVKNMETKVVDTHRI